MRKGKYEVYVATDACGNLNTQAQDMAVRHMIQAGTKPMECRQVLSELRQPEAHILLPDAHLPLYERVS